MPDCLACEVTVPEEPALKRPALLEEATSQTPARNERGDQTSPETMPALTRARTTATATLPRVHRLTFRTVSGKTQEPKFSNPPQDETDPNYRELVKEN